MPRLFTALEVPTALSYELTRLRGGLLGARWIDPSNFHITLRYIGNVNNHVASDVIEELHDIRVHEFPIKVAGLDGFGGNKPRSLHVKIERNEALIALQADIERAMKRVGLPPDGRKFSPHVTLARLRGTSPHELASFISQMGRCGPFEFYAERFVLMSSKESRGGGPYIVEDEFPLLSFDDTDYDLDEDQYGDYLNLAHVDARF